MDIGIIMLVAAASALSYLIGRAHESETQLAQLISAQLAPKPKAPRTMAPNLVHSPALGAPVEAKLRK